jgi:predicted Rdx family selenoprotein
VKAWLEARGRGPVEVQPGKSGQFDVFLGAQLAYSRYATGRFPSEAELEEILRQEP